MWKHDAKDNEVMVLHTLVVDPLERSGIVKKCAVGEYPKSWIGRSQAA